MRCPRASACAAALAVSGLAHAAPVFVNDADSLAIADIDTGEASLVGFFGLSRGETMTDIALDPLGRLWGVSFSRLYEIDPITAATTLVGTHGVSGANALVFDEDGTAYLAGSRNRSLFTLDPETAGATRVGPLGVASAGDLAFHDGALHLLVEHSGNDAIAVVDPDAGSASVVGSTGQNRAYGLASVGGDLVMASRDDFFTIDPVTGDARFRSTLDLAGFGDVYGMTASAWTQIPAPGSTGVLAITLGAVMVRWRRV
jgi:streptogramin lyase